MSRPSFLPEVVHRAGGGPPSALVMPPVVPLGIVTLRIVVLGMVAATAWSAAAHANPAAAEGPERVRTACDRGLDWLVAAQQPDGSWGSGGFRGSIAVTAQAAMAFVGAGNTAVSGARSESVARAVAHLVAASGPDGLIAGNEQAAHGPMYGHAFATLVLAELYGETDQDERLATILDRARAVIEESQNDEGGWRYQPARREADASVTAAMIVTLRGLRNSGFTVAESVVDRGIAYLRRLQNPDGGFRYRLDPGPSGSPRTAAAVFALLAAGVRDEETIDRGFAWLEGHPIQLGTAAGAAADDGYALYGLSYSAAARWQRGGAAWEDWYAAAAAMIVAAQEEDGSWRDPSCAEYGTSAALSVLQMPNDVTPLFQRSRRTAEERQP
jgi:squalene cyclase